MCFLHMLLPKTLNKTGLRFQLQTEDNHLMTRTIQQLLGPHSASSWLRSVVEHPWFYCSYGKEWECLEESMRVCWKPISELVVQIVTENLKYLSVTGKLLIVFKKDLKKMYMCFMCMLGGREYLGTNFKYILIILLKIFVFCGKFCPEKGNFSGFFSLLY